MNMINRSLFACAILCCAAFTTVKDGATIQPDNLYPKVKLETTMGDIVIELDRYKAPLSVNNFLRYVANRGYEGTVFHRIVPNFIVQGGGYDQEFNAQSSYGDIFNESGNGRKNSIYTVAMARMNQPHTGNRQFFFNINDNPSLDPGRSWGYAVFGNVISGTDVIDKMGEVETHFEPALGWRDVPVEPIILLKATVLPEK